MVLAGIAGVLILIGLIPVRVSVQARDGAVAVQVRLLGMRVVNVDPTAVPSHRHWWNRLLQKLRKSGKTGEKTPQKKQKKPKKTKKQQKIKGPKRLPFSVPVLLRLAVDALKSVGRLLRKILRGIRIDCLDAAIIVGGTDAAQTGLLFGRLAAILADSEPVLRSLFRVGAYHVYLDADFTGVPTRWQGDARVSLRIGTVVLAVLGLLGRIIGALIRAQWEQTKRSMPQREELRRQKKIEKQLVQEARKTVNRRAESEG